MTVQLFNDQVHDTSMSGTLHLFTDVEKLTGTFKVKIPENEADTNYRRILISSPFDAGKLLDGARGNFVMRTFAENFLKSIDFKPKFPLKKVSLHLNKLHDSAYCTLVLGSLQHEQLHNH